MNIESVSQSNSKMQKRTGAWYTHTQAESEESQMERLFPRVWAGKKN